MEHGGSIPLQLLCLFPWSSDGEAVLRNWNLWDMSLAWHSWASRGRSLKVPCLCSSSCFPAYSYNGTSTGSLWHDVSHSYCHVVPAMTDWKALKLWEKKTFSSHTASARYSVTVTRWLLHSLFTSPASWALVQQVTPLHSSDHGNKRLVRKNRHSSHPSQPRNFFPSLLWGMSNSSQHVADTSNHFSF